MLFVYSRNVLANMDSILATWVAFLMTTIVRRDLVHRNQCTWQQYATIIIGMEAAAEVLAFRISGILTIPTIVIVIAGSAVVFWTVTTYDHRNTPDQFMLKSGILLILLLIVALIDMGCCFWNLRLGYYL